MEKKSKKSFLDRITSVGPESALAMMGIAVRHCSGELNPLERTIADANETLEPYVDHAFEAIRKLLPISLR